MEKLTLRVIVPLTTRYSRFLQSKKLSLTIIAYVRDIYLVSLVHNTCRRLEFWQPDGLIQQWFIIDQTRWLKTTRRCHHNPWLRKKNQTILLYKSVTVIQVSQVTSIQNVWICLLTSACSILLANSCAAKPPNTTEWIAPSRAQANMAITAWNKNSEFSTILVRTIFLWEVEATLLFN